MKKKVEDLNLQSAYILNEVEHILGVDFDTSTDKWYKAVGYLEKEINLIIKRKKHE